MLETTIDFALTVERKFKMNETIEELEYKYYMMEMQDHWDSEDYRYADELKEKIRKLKEENEDE